MKINIDIDNDLYTEIATIASIALGFIFWGVFNFPVGVGLGLLVFVLFAILEDTIVGELHGSGTQRDKPEGYGRDGANGSSDKRESAEGTSGSVSNNTITGTGPGPNTDPYIVLSRPTDGPGVGTP